MWQLYVENVELYSPPVDQIKKSIYRFEPSLYVMVLAKAISLQTHSVNKVYSRLKVYILNSKQIMDDVLFCFFVVSHKNRKHNFSDFSVCFSELVD